MWRTNVIEKKSDGLSDIYREQGNKKFAQKKFNRKMTNVLWIYNKVRTKNFIRN